MVESNWIEHEGGYVNSTMRLVGDIAVITILDCSRVTAFILKLMDAHWSKRAGEIGAIVLIINDLATNGAQILENAEVHLQSFGFSKINPKWRALGFINYKYYKEIGEIGAFQNKMAIIKALEAEHVRMKGIQPTLMMPEIRLEFRRIQDSSLYYDGATEYYTVDIKREGVVFCLAGKSYLLSDPSMTSGVLEDALSRIEKKQRLKNLYEVPRRHFDTWMKNLIDKTTDPILTLEQKNELHANLLTRYSYQEIENFCAGHRSYDDKKIVDISWSEYWFWFPFLDFHIVVQKQKEIIIFEGENAFEEARSLYAQKMTEAVNKRLDIEIAKVHG